MICLRFRAIHTFGQAYFGQGKDSIVLSNLDCSGFEDSLESCNSAGWFKHTCDHSEDAGVECLGNDRFTSNLKSLIKKYLQ